MELQKRATCWDPYYNRYYNCNSGWYLWGRWIVFGAIVISAFLVFFLFSCLSARRRRRQGLQPYRGTGWTGWTGWGQGPNQGYSNYNPQYEQQSWNGQPPQYSQAGGYYGNPQPTGNYGHELQQPGNVYRGGDNVYEPPAGPPPKKDETIR